MGRRKTVKRKGRTMMLTKSVVRNRKLIFPLLLAAICSNPCNKFSIVKKCLRRLFHYLPHVNLAPILSLLPLLLNFECGEIVRRSLKIIGAASLVSFEMNEEISSEDAIIKGMISHLGSSEKGTRIAACNSLLDLSTTSVGQQRLIEFDALPYLLHFFIQEFEALQQKIGLSSDMIFSKKDEYPIMLLQGAITLINSSTMKQLERISLTALSEKFLVCLKRLWDLTHRQRLKTPAAIADEGNIFSIWNIKKNDFSECIFRLSINGDLYSNLIDVESVEKSIFGFGEDSINMFLSETWEISPLLMRKQSNASSKQDNLFSSFIRSLDVRERSSSFLSSMLEAAFSCPPFASGELDILEVIKEIKNHLGFPLIYQQDIRVVKTQENEQHYFQGATHILTTNEIIKCEEAFTEGYSIALRGMEFRNHDIAAISDVFASLLGQPSTGVNLYLTPSNSQGLARHSDDHCVFVCQLIGVKRWSVFLRKESRLPRLYESSQDVETHEIDNCQDFFLEEGEVLYIPRGFPHEARTSAHHENRNIDPGFSFHLTLAVEIEPPFEWEGFMHIALCCWDTKQSESFSKSTDSSQWTHCALSVHLLHITITLLSKDDPVFRRACLVAANPLKEWLHRNQITFFRELIRKINDEASFLRAYEDFNAAIEKREDPLEHLRWMKHLGSQSRIPNDGFLFKAMAEERNGVEACYMRFKSRFCDEVKFEDVEKEYKIVVEMHRKVRKQYSNGMLSLHSAVI